MTLQQPRLVDLPTDVLLRILGLCDVEDVLRVEMTCRVLRDIVATRHLWLAHLRGLPNECAPDLPPHISVESLDCTGLKTLVVRAVRGNRNWNSPSPKATREIKLIVDNPIRESALDVSEASLVPGGDYLVVRWSSGHPALWKDNYVQLLEVSNGEKIWLYPDPDNCSGSILRKLWVYGVDRVSENVLRVATAETVEKRYSKLMAIKVFEIDLRQRRSEKIYDHQLNAEPLMQPRTLRLGGDDLYLEGDHIVLVDCEKNLIFLNWKSSCCTNLTCDADIEASQLVPGFLFTVHDKPGSSILRVTDVHQALEAASGQERPPPTIDMDTLPAVRAADLRFDNRDLYTFDMQAVNAFWRQEENIDIYLHASLASDHGFSAIVLRYSFTPSTRTFEYKCTASLLLGDDEPLPEIVTSLPGIVSSRSGRLLVVWSQVLDGFDVHRILRDKPKYELRHRVLPREIVCYGMDPYSGAIFWSEMRLSSTEVRISYFD